MTWTADDPDPGWKCFDQTCLLVNEWVIAFFGSVFICRRVHDYFDL